MGEIITYLAEKRENLLGRLGRKEKERPEDSKTLEMLKRQWIMSRPLAGLGLHGTASIYERSIWTYGLDAKKLPSPHWCSQVHFFYLPKQLKQENPDFLYERLQNSINYAIAFGQSAARKAHEVLPREEPSIVIFVLRNVEEKDIHILRPFVGALREATAWSIPASRIWRSFKRGKEESSKSFSDRILESI